MTDREVEQSGLERGATLTDIREGIDAIDREIVALIARRQQWVARAGALKRDESGVRAPSRVDEVIARVRRMAAEAGAAPDVVEGAYRAMIAGFIDLEMSMLATRTADGAPADGAPAGARQSAHVSNA